MQLGFAPMVGLDSTDMATANDLLVEFGHYIGPCRRPFGQQAFVLYDDAGPVSVAVSASIVSSVVAGYLRNEVVELARLATRPGDVWATRVMLRLWREVCAPAWTYWPVRAAVAYSQNNRHEGRIYRFDGWERVSAEAGSNGEHRGGTWSRPRPEGHATRGKKSLWLWRLDRDC